MAATKRKDWNDLLGGTGKTASAPAPDNPKEPPVTVLMHTITGNPSNPRAEEDYTDVDPEFAELKASMKEIGQLQPLAVVSRAVFERAKPDALEQATPKTRKQLQDADWVVITGNRRLAAARQLGWTRIDIRVHDQLGDEEGRIDEAVLIENIHRKNLAPVQEAEFLQAMLERYGSQEKVAARIRKSQVYVSQRLALLRLAPEIRDEVDAGTLKIKDARQLAGRTTDHAEQLTRVAELKAKAAQPKAPRTRAKPPVQNPVLKTAPDPEPADKDVVSDPVVQNPVLNSASLEASVRPETLPEQRSEPAVDVEDTALPEGTRSFPYENSQDAVQYLIFKMPPDVLAETTKGLIRHHERIGAPVV